MSVSCITFSLAWPVILTTLYYYKIERSEPLPDLDDKMTISMLKQIYGTCDIEHIERKAYTNSKHKALIDKYGVLLNDLELE